jgi:CsoR family transcriptional regulator, copper-sensing transcriptional repressor
MIDNTPRGVYHGGMNANKPKMVRRLKIIEGQVRGLREMVEKDTYCIDVITQGSAIKQGLSNVEDMLMEHHLSHCVVDQIKGGKPSKAVDEVLKVYKLKRK